MDIKNTKQALAGLDSLKNFLIVLSDKKKLEDPVSLDQFGETVRLRRKEHNMTQVDFAALVGVSKNLLVSIEKGSLSPSMANYKKVADALGIKIAFI